jgi:hypothetical protein
MKYGIHLPHAGEQATPALIRRDAERAEDLVWRSACAPPNPLSAVAQAVAARARRDRSIPSGRHKRPHSNSARRRRVPGCKSAAAHK